LNDLSLSAESKTVIEGTHGVVGIGQP